MLNQEAQEKHQKEYDAAMVRIDAQVLNCKYCKGAKTRAARTGDTRPRSQECKKHAERRRLTYVTSPISETYWSS